MLRLLLIQETNFLFSRSEPGRREAREHHKGIHRQLPPDPHLHSRVTIWPDWASERGSCEAADLRDSSLKSTRRDFQPHIPEMVGNSVDLDGMVPLVEEQGIAVGLAGGVLW